MSQPSTLSLIRAKITQATETLEHAFMISYPVAYMVGGGALIVMSTGVLPFLLGATTIGIGIARSSLGIARAVKMAIPNFDEETPLGKIVAKLKDHENRLFVNTASNITEFSSGLVLCGLVATLPGALPTALVCISLIMILAGGCGMVAGVGTIGMNAVVSQRPAFNGPAPAATIKISLPGTVPTGPKTTFNSAGDPPPTLIASAPINPPNPTV